MSLRTDGPGRETSSVPGLLEREVEAFNEGVRTGDWSSLVALFSEDGLLEFEGIPVGPFRGRDAIAEAYRSMPPDDEIVLLEGGPRYAWSKEPKRAAGELLLEERDGRIVRLRVLYERFTEDGEPLEPSSPPLGTVAAVAGVAIVIWIMRRRRSRRT